MTAVTCGDPPRLGPVPPRSSGTTGGGGFRQSVLLLLKICAILVCAWFYTDSVLLEVFVPRPGPPPPVPGRTAGGIDSTLEPADGAVARGRNLFEASGCNACHSIDGSRRIGPSLAGIWGTEQLLEDGSTAFVDEDYVTESIVEPQARVVQGYDAAMPSYAGLLTPRELAEIAAYIRSLS